MSGKQRGKKSGMPNLDIRLTAYSIIFTCWTRTLDLIQIYLKRRGFAPQNFQRIDGDCPTAKRERILEDFARNDNLRVLIMTTGTGAVGQVQTSNSCFFFGITDVDSDSTSPLQTECSSSSHSGILRWRIRRLLALFALVRHKRYWSLDT